MRGKGNAGKKWRPCRWFAHYHWRAGPRPFYQRWHEHHSRLLHQFCRCSSWHLHWSAHFGWQVKVKIPPATQAGKNFATKKGTSSVQEYGRGDQLININIWTPRDLTAEEKAILEKLRHAPNFQPKPTKEDKGFLSGWKRCSNEKSFHPDDFWLAYTHVTLIPSTKVKQHFLKQAGAYFTCVLWFWYPGHNYFLWNDARCKKQMKITGTKTFMSTLKPVFRMAKQKKILFRSNWAHRRKMARKVHFRLLHCTCPIATEV